MSKKRHTTGKGPSQRQLRVGELIRHALADILAREPLHDPDLENAVITVSEVRVSPDLRHATAFVSLLGGGDPSPLLAGLKRVKPFLRGRVAREVRLKYAPDLHFEADESFDRAAAVDALLHSPEVARDLAANERPAADGQSVETDDEAGGTEDGPQA